MEVPKDPERGIGLDTPGGDIRVSLPNAADAGSATKLADGTVVYPSKEGTADAVVPLSNGVQVLITIANSDAPTIYRNEVIMTSGQRLVETSDGGVQVIDDNGDPALILPAPWAKDANGRAVPTRYEIDESAVVQVVEHTTVSDVAYPVVADPTYYYWWGGKRSFSSAQATKATVVAAVAALKPSFAPAAVVTAAAIQWCNAKGKGIWVYWTWAGHVWCTSQ